MAPEPIFSIASFAATTGWALLIFLPGRRWTSIVSGSIVPGLLAGVYVVLIALHFWGADGGFGTLNEVARLFANPWLLLAGWLHYLAFDLLIGTWEARDARAKGVSHWALVPCLLGTFLFGPAGWLLYLGARRFYSNGTVTSAGLP
jgi:hypothetical protein